MHFSIVPLFSQSAIKGSLIVSINTHWIDTLNCQCLKHWGYSVKGILTLAMT